MTSSAGATASAGASTAAGSGAGASDACNLASKSDVESVIGSLTTTPAKVELPLVGFTVAACVYSSNDGTLTTALGPKNLSKESFDIAMRTVPDLAGTVSGVGDSAYSIRLDAPTGLAGAAGIVATKSGNYFTIQAAHKTKSSSTLMTSVTDLAKKTAGMF